MNHVEKIKKLLRLARDGAATAAEAANALKRAMELIRQHNIDVGTLDLDESTERMVREEIEIGARISLPRLLAAQIIQAFFHVRVVWVTHTVIRRGWPARAKRLVILGAESDVMIARYVFDFLVGAVARSQSQWAADEKKARRKVTAGKKENFLNGWFYGIAAQLDRAEAAVPLEGSRAAIVLASRESRLEAYANQEFPNAGVMEEREKRRVNQTALERGYREGRKTSINTPLAGNPGEPLQLC